MIQTLTGTVRAHKKQEISLLIGPITVACSVPDASVFPIGSQKTVYTHLHWNQEQGPSLFGFANETDKTIFLLATDCSGVGPRLGLAILADVGADGFIEAVQQNNEKLLSQVSGIGAKKAEQMIVQLKHKVQNMIDSGLSPMTTDSSTYQTVTQALRALNYSRSEISQAIEFVRSKNTDTVGTFDQLMRQALSYLSKQPH